jgi:hypothetical protein
MGNLRKSWLYLILPAVIAGLFGITPKIYDIMSEPNAKLTYTITRSPELQTVQEFRRIVAITVVNAGKKALHKTHLELSLLAGTIESSRMQASQGLLSQITKEGQRKISVDIPTMHPSEKITIVAMLKLTTPDAPEEVALRSEEILGVEQRGLDDNVWRGYSRYRDSIGALLSAISVFVMALIIKKKGILYSYNDREDIIYYILMRVGLRSISDHLRFSDAPLTYIRTADILLDLGLNNDNETKNKCAMALKCLLFVSRITSTSRKEIERNISILLGSSYSQSEVDRIKSKNQSMSDAIEIRNCIDEYINTSANSVAAVPQQ